MFKIPNLSIDLVVVTKKSDYKYLQFFKRSIELFNENFDQKWVIVPPQDLSFFKNKFKNTNFSIVSERDLIPSDIKQPGWFLQQLIKISAYQIVKSKFFLTMDSDAILVKDFDKQNLFHNGKAKFTKTPISPDNNFHLEWDEWAKRVLNCKEPTYKYQVTPCIFNTNIVESLVDYCGGLRGLNEKMPWTECCLYGNYLDKENLFNKFYCERKGSFTYGCWDRRSFVNWNVNSAIDNEIYSFALIQSNFKPTVPELKEKYAPIFSDYKFIDFDLMNHNF